MNVTRIRTTVALFLAGVLIPAGFAGDRVVSTTNPAVALDRITPVAHIEKRGAGPVSLILIPGLSCDWRVYDAFMTRNAASYRMFAITLPGFGGSEPPPAIDGATYEDNLWLSNAEQAILKLIADEKIDRPVIVGHSLGGHLATRMATRHSEKIRAAVAIDGWPLFPPIYPGMNAAGRAMQVQQMIASMKNTSDEQWPQQQRMSLAMMVKDQNRAQEIGDMCAATSKATTVRYMAEMTAADLRGELAKISVPSLTIVAVAAPSDTQFAEMSRKIIAEQFKNARPSTKYVFFDDTRHFIMDDRPAELDAAIATFLAGKPVADVKAATQPAAKPRD